MDRFFFDFQEYKDDTFVGHVEVSTDKESLKDDRVWVHNLYVFEHYRHNGIGTKLMNRVIDACKGLSIHRVYLWCKPALIPFYKKFGAERAHQNMYGYELMMIKTE